MIQCVCVCGRSSMDRMQNNAPSDFICFIDQALSHSNLIVKCMSIDSNLSSIFVQSVIPCPFTLAEKLLDTLLPHNHTVFAEKLGTAPALLSITMEHPLFIQVSLT